MEDALTNIDRKGNRSDLVSLPGQEIAGVAAGPFGSAYFTHTDPGGGADLRVREFNGKVRQVADLGAFEAIENPDQIQTYGFQGLTPDCEALLPPQPTPITAEGAAADGLPTVGRGSWQESSG